MRIEGRSISPGHAEGKLLLLREPFSFLGGVDPRTGRLTVEGDDRDLGGAVMAFPHGKGSTVGSYVMVDMRSHGVQPAAIINLEAEPIVTTGAVMSGIAMVDRVDLDLLNDGDLVRVDGDRGIVELPKIQEEHVVVGILRSGEKVLLLKGKPIGSDTDHWAGISGHVQEGEEPEEAAARRMREEVGVVPPLSSRGEKVMVRVSDRVWVIHPFIFDVEETIDLDSEHAWVDIRRAGELVTTPVFERVLRSL